jgi:hypothetical protein
MNRNDVTTLTHGSEHIADDRQATVSNLTNVSLTNSVTTSCDQAEPAVSACLALSYDLAYN